MLCVTKDSKKIGQQRKGEECVTGKGGCEPVDSALTRLYKASKCQLAQHPQITHHDNMQRRKAMTTAALIYQLSLFTLTNPTLLHLQADGNDECDSRQREKHFAITCAFPFTGSASSCLACH